MSEHLCAGGHDEGQERVAEDGALACRGCRLATEDALNDLPQLYLDLLDPSRVPTGVRAKRAPDEAPGPMGYGTHSQPAAGDARALIRAAIDRWTLWLWEHRGIHAPRAALAANFSSARDAVTVHKFAAIDADTPKAAKGHLRSMLAATRTAHLYSADLEHHDTVAAGAAHLRNHLHLLLAAEQAGAVIDGITHAHRVARSRATPTSPPGKRIGACPQPSDTGPCKGNVRTLDGDPNATCRRCGTTAPIDWWWDQMHPAAVALEQPTATSAELAAWLSRRYCRAITTSTIRKAASQGAKRSDGTRGPHLTRLGKDATGRTLYDVAEAIAHYDTLYPISALDDSRKAS